MPSRYIPPSTRHIRRIDSHNSHGYQVHIQRNGQVITKHFADSHYPSPAQARKAAMAFRDQLLAELPPPANQRGFRTVAHSNTGEVGISLTYMPRRSGEKKPYITASASPAPGKMMGRKFSVERYGYEGAIAAAKAWRAEVLQQRQQRGTPARRTRAARNSRQQETSSEAQV
jgi:hypothetical protein